MKPTGWSIFGMGFAFLLIETHYFGSNFLPESAAEVIADGIGGLICAIGMMLVAFGKQHNNKGTK